MALYVPILRRHRRPDVAGTPIDAVESDVDTLKTAGERAINEDDQIHDALMDDRCAVDQLEVYPCGLANRVNPVIFDSAEIARVIVDPHLRGGFANGDDVVHDEYGPGTVRAHPDGLHAEHPFRTHVYFDETDVTTLQTVFSSHLTHADVEEVDA